MKDVTDIIGWLVGGLTAIVFFGWRYDKKSDNDKFKSLFDAQRAGQERLAKVETKVEGIQAHLVQTVDDIKAQNSKMAEDVTAIKIAIAGMPKRKRDEG